MRSIFYVEMITFVIGDDRKVFFFCHHFCGEMALNNFFPYLFLLAEGRDASVPTYFPYFRRRRQIRIFTF